MVETGHACVVCWRGPADNAHLIDRSLVPDPYHDPRRVISLCREHHDAYDNHELDVLPYLEPGHRSELARAVEIFGLIGTLERVTGSSWRPVREETAIARDIARVSGTTDPAGELAVEMGARHV